MSAEMFPLKGRGAIMVLTRIGWPLGALCATLIQRLVLPINIEKLAPFGEGWRLCLVLSSFPLYVLLLVGLFLVPESPRYYIAVGKYDRAFAVLRYIRACSCSKRERERLKEDKEDLVGLLENQRDERERGVVSGGSAEGVDQRSRKRKVRKTDTLPDDDAAAGSFRGPRKSSSCCEKCFPRRLWMVPTLSYTRCRFC